MSLKRRIEVLEAAIAAGEETGRPSFRLDDELARLSDGQLAALVEAADRREALPEPFRFTDRTSVSIRGQIVALKRFARRDADGYARLLAETLPDEDGEPVDES